MDTPQIETKKKYTLNTFATGYGPKGEHSLSDWRDECMSKLKSGKDAFLAWQESWMNEINKDLSNVSFNFNKNVDIANVGKKVNQYKPYSLDFSSQIFKEDIDLSKYQFNQDTYFDSAIFEKKVTFINCIFNNNVDFQNAQFSGVVDFSDSTFLSVNFTNTKFRCACLAFTNVRFKDKVDFESATFPGQPTSFNGVSFKNAKFISGVTFQGNKIGCNIDFEGTFFSEVANFKETIFYEMCTFKDANFSSESSDRFKFKYNHLGANFTLAKFMLDTDFSGCIFTMPSYFLKTEFNGDVVFNNVKFSDDVRFFDTDFLGGAFFNDASFTGEAVKRLGQMKRMAEDNGQTDQALNFNALELDAKVKQVDASYMFILFTWLYKNVADYGRSFTRPILFYVLLLWLSFVYAYGHPDNSTEKSISNTNLCEPKPLNLSREKAAFEYTMFRAGGLMDFTDTGKQNNAVNCRLFEEPIEPPLMRAWGIFKGIASIALLFLAALGLRNKYRIK